VSFGERLSVRVMAARLNQLGVPAQHFDSWTLGLRTTSDFGKAEVDPTCYEALRNNIKKLDESMYEMFTDAYT
jgi:aspartate kinase